MAKIKYLPKKENNTITVRELINELLKYESDEIIDFLLWNDEGTKPIIVKQFGTYSDLPYIEFKEV